MLFHILFISWTVGNWNIKAQITEPNVHPVRCSIFLMILQLHNSKINQRWHIFCVKLMACTMTPGAGVTPIKPKHILTSESMTYCWDMWVRSADYVLNQELCGTRWSWPRTLKLRHQMVWKKFGKRQSILKHIWQLIGGTTFKSASIPLQLDQKCATSAAS